MINQRGYSILELMMVVCVIGVLCMVSMTEYNKVHNRAYVGAAMSDLQVLRKALSMFDAEWGVYPQGPAATPAELVVQLMDPVGQAYLNAPADQNFQAFQYTPPAAGDAFGDYTISVVCKDFFHTRVTVHGTQDMQIIRGG